MDEVHVLVFKLMNLFQVTFCRFYSELDCVSQRLQISAEINDRNLDHNPDHPQNLMDLSFTRDTPLIKVSCKSMNTF